MIDVLLVVGGMAILIKAADLLVDGASSLAFRFGISALTIGLTVVSFGTSTPELFVTTSAALRDNADLAVANILGSNIFNILVVLGVAAIICPLPARDQTVLSEIPFSLTAALLVGFLANTALFAETLELSIDRLDGAILLFFFVLFMLYVYKTSRSDSANPFGVEAHGTLPRSLIYIGLGLAGLYLGGNWVVSGALGIAAIFGVSDAVVGLTIVAIGTSLPELVGSAVAAYKKETDIAIGNVVGSNIFNLLWILGLTSSIVELPFESVSNIDIVTVIASSSLIIVAMVASRGATIRRTHGVLFIALYVVYFAYVFLRD